MKIGIITTHSWPIPNWSHGGDVVILDLATALAEMGHRVHLFAPVGTVCAGVDVFHMPCAQGTATPSAEECERTCLEAHRGSLEDEDVLHDFSITKYVTKSLPRIPAVRTLMGGAWMDPSPAGNLVAWSAAHRGRIIRGVDDWWGSPIARPEWTTRGFPVSGSDVSVCYGGVDTSWYTPGVSVGDSFFLADGFYLWMNRWHPAKGYSMAIELAKATGINLVVAGEHPGNRIVRSNPSAEGAWCEEARALAAGLPNVKLVGLPEDPGHHELKRSLYRQASALLYTVQFQEPFGLSQVEAMSCGTPVIGTCFGSVPEVVGHGVSGFVCDNTIEDVAKHLDVSGISRAACREYAVRRFDRSVMARSYLNEYSKAIAATAPSS